MVLTEIETAIHNLKYWTKPKTYSAPFPILAGSTKVIPEPYGISLIFAPYNYPIQLALSPLIGAISAGNCVDLKPSEYTPYTSKALKCLLREVFPTHLAWVLMAVQKSANPYLNNLLTTSSLQEVLRPAKRLWQRLQKILSLSLRIRRKKPSHC